MRVLITGSNGLLGQKLVRKITTETSWELCATARGANRMVNKGEAEQGYIYRSMDVTDPQIIAHVFSKFKPQAVIHCAAMTQVDDCEKDQDLCQLLNVTTVDYLLKASKAHNAFFLQVSTDFIFDGLKGPYLEDDEPNPISVYGQSKLDAEILVKAYEGDWAIARTVLVYGIAKNMSRSNFILWVKSSLESGKEIKVVDDQFRSPTLAEDLAKGCMLIVEKNATGVYNISGKEVLTPFKMAQMTANYFNLDTSKMQRVDASSFTQPAARPPKTGFIIDKAVNDLGYDPVSFKEGIGIVAKQYAVVRGEG